jgi:hypothetical protein
VGASWSSAARLMVAMMATITARTTAPIIGRPPGR